MTDNELQLYIRATHQYAYRCGQWAAVVDVVHMNERPCYVVKFVDGKRDEWPIYDDAAGYEFASVLK